MERRTPDLGKLRSIIGDVRTQEIDEILLKIICAAEEAN
jgi:hypothetical protein